MLKEGTALSAMPVEDRPRERLLRLGSSALSDAEILALVLGSGRPGQNVLALSASILERTGGFRGLVAMNVAQLQELPGVGPATAGRLMAAVEIWRRAIAASSRMRLLDSSAIAKAVVPELRHRPTERIVVVIADRALRLVDILFVDESRGGKLDIGQLLRTVLLHGGGAFAIAHNHSAGNLALPPADRETLAAIRSAAEAAGLRFLDYLVVAEDEWRSVA